MNYINDTELEQVEGGFLPFIVAVALVILASSTYAGVSTPAPSCTCGPGCC